VVGDGDASAVTCGLPDQDQDVVRRWCETAATEAAAVL